MRATQPELFSPRRDGDRDLLPFLTCHAFFLCGSGDTRRAARRPEAVTPVLVPLGCPSLPNRDASAAAPPPRLAPAEHSEDRRARALGPSEGRVPVRLRRCLVPAAGACASMRMPTAFPSSAPFGHPLSSARHAPGREAPRCGGPTKTFVPTTPREGRRHPEDQDAFHRHDTRRIDSYAEGLLPPAFAPALPLTPPALGPAYGPRAFGGHCKVTVRSPADP